ncbi:orotidine-5'-phosphate decarboxylase [candidate division FCPU426 bacterium]|nr:orotidine-5'-phosphate decarboxylase [candidate division FCPU426 bacterium]
MKRAMLKPKDRLFVALDVDDLHAADVLINRMQGVVSQYKLGAQLLAAAGPEAVRHLKRRGYGVFYDAKFHDIPNTVEAAVKNACRLGVTIVNVHTTGGTAMMAAAAAAAREVARKLRQPKTMVLGVTVLTSLSQGVVNKELCLRRQLRSYVVHLAKLAQKAGLDGVVASPMEIEAIRKACGRDFIILTPGIRPAGSDQGDQKRTMTPKQAIAAGANFIVVGRPVYQASDPLQVVRSIYREIEEAE